MWHCVAYLTHKPVPNIVRSWTVTSKEDGFDFWHTLPGIYFKCLCSVRYFPLPWLDREKSTLFKKDLKKVDAFSNVIFKFRICLNWVTCLFCSCLTLGAHCFCRSKFWLPPVLHSSWDQVVIYSSIHIPPIIYVLFSLFFFCLCQIESLKAF